MSDYPAITLHSRFNRIMAIALWVVAALMVIGGMTSGDLRLAWVYPAALLVAFFAWAGLWRPYVRVDDSGVTLQNVTHRVEIPWSALIHVDTRYALTLYTPGQKFAAWAAPAPGILSSSLAGRSAANREARATGSALRPGDLLGTESGNAATVVREQWQARVERGGVDAGSADAVPVSRHWDLPVAAASVALIIATGWLLATNG
ncbi:hypothetical protein ASD65_04655 [Microbacterium sp. Root61]|uniref:PH domain-containing protein n=1 Tax=Microbacterium sp. Root61 TaxID=1736570 RepID=UPI0006F7C40F|nr:PH domain-containing protein [Microbacterium sp. Root61]KRA23792.1 hypothetical protein ASD65_04655 [Microbacterium sp. Root61]